MKRPVALMRGLAALVWLAASGCSTMREIPREDYTQRSERKRVVVDTRAGMHHVFDFARFEGDTLKGFRQRDVEGGFEEYDTMSIPMDDVVRVSARRIDWYRSLLLGGTSLGAVVVLVNSSHVQSSDMTPTGPPCKICNP